eukprot:TRINITY_DN6096_c0_g1_i1.p1 TRINITY_DN6096_c0_g1~~TRINITY_DN6096_c0_g1_i1.p1  ORF type:complete len:911 (-),score=225.90 TRINITY_DN6096_c0_g1_i1:94-2697(-)
MCDNALPLLSVSDAQVLESECECVRFLHSRLGREKGSKKVGFAKLPILLAKKDESADDRRTELLGNGDEQKGVPRTNVLKTVGSAVDHARRVVDLLGVLAKEVGQSEDENFSLSEFVEWIVKNPNEDSSLLYLTLPLFDLQTGITVRSSDPSATSDTSISLEQWLSDSLLACRVQASAMGSELEALKGRDEGRDEERRKLVTENSKHLREIIHLKRDHRKQLATLNEQLASGGGAKPDGGAASSEVADDAALKEATAAATTAASAATVAASAAQAAAIRVRELEEELAREKSETADHRQRIVELEEEVKAQQHLNVEAQKELQTRGEVQEQPSELQEQPSPSPPGVQIGKEAMSGEGEVDSDGNHNPDVTRGATSGEVDVVDSDGNDNGDVGDVGDDCDDGGMGGVIHMATDPRLPVKPDANGEDAGSDEMSGRRKRPLSNWTRGKLRPPSASATPDEGALDDAVVVVATTTNVVSFANPSLVSSPRAGSEEIVAPKDSAGQIQDLETQLKEMFVELTALKTTNEMLECALEATVQANADDSNQLPRTRHRGEMVPTLSSTTPISVADVDSKVLQRAASAALPRKGVSLFGSRPTSFDHAGKPEGGAWREKFLVTRSKLDATRDELFSLVRLVCHDYQRRMARQNLRSYSELVNCSDFSAMTVTAFALRQATDIASGLARYPRAIAAPQADAEKTKVKQRNTMLISKIRYLEERIGDEETLARAVYASLKVGDISFPERAGYLTKQGGSVKTWKRRFFLLKDNFILYYKRSKADEEPVGVIYLDQVEVTSESENKTKRKNCFKISTPGRTYNISADRAVERDIWIESVRAAVPWYDVKSQADSKEKRNERRFNIEFLTAQPAATSAV